MNLIYLGKIVNTHGIKGEIRILSNFKYKKDVFKINNELYIGKNKEKVIITSYRIHKNYDMITLKDINDINDVLKYKGLDVYFDRDAININGILDEDLIGMEVYSDKYIGIVSDILSSNVQEFLVVKNDNVINMIPYVDHFIKKIDLDKKRIDINEIEGLINEN